ncbi:MAG: hypothetical protein WB581_06660 [Halobacteriota archaeon]
MLSQDAERFVWVFGGPNVMIWGMDLWVFTAFILIYASVVFGIIYGLWPRKDEDEQEDT